MEHTKFEVGDLVWDSEGHNFGCIMMIDRGVGIPKYTPCLMIYWLDGFGNSSWEFPSSFSPDGPNGIPAIDLMPF